MERNFSKWALIALTFTLMLAGCKSNKAVQQQYQEEEVIDLSYVVAGLKAVSPDTTALQYLSAGTNLGLTVNGTNISIKGKLRIKRGEGVQLSITPLGLIEVACIEFLPDRIHFINKLSKTYTEVPYSEAGAIGLGGINYKVIEGIFLNYAFLPDGRPACYGLKKMSIQEQGNHYRLDTKENSAMKYSFFIDRNSGDLTSLSGKSSTGEDVKCDYSDFENIGGGVQFPNDIDINFKGGSTTIRIDMELSKASNKTFSFSSRSISSSYRKQSIGDFIKSIK